MVFCFAKAQLSLGLIDPLQKLVLEYMYESNSLPPIDRILYLKRDPVLCYGRMKRRGRSEATDVPLGYLLLLHRAYEEFIESFGDKVVVIDGNGSEEDVRSRVIRELK